MKRSSKILASGVIYCFAMILGFIALTRILYDYDPSGRGQEETPVRAPGKRVPWYRLDLGLRRTGFSFADNTHSIFWDIPLYYWNHSHSHLMNISFSRRFELIHDRMLSFTYVAVHWDSISWQEIADKGIRVLILQRNSQSRNSGSAPAGRPIFSSLDTFRRQQNGRTEYYSRGRVGCEWSSGGWHTDISVPIAACGGDSIKSVELRNKMTDRILAYYASLQ